MAKLNNPRPEEMEQREEIAKQDAERDIQEVLGSGQEVEPVLGGLKSLEAELGLQEVELDQAVIDTVAAENSSENIDEDGIATDELSEESSEEIIDDRPQNQTESYGTGLQGQPSDRTGRFSRRSSASQYHEASPILTGGDVDANYEQANAVGDEAVGGTAVTPDQDIVDELGAAVGIEMDDRAFLRTEDMLLQRDNRRWEMDPTSSEDYEERREL